MSRPLLSTLSDRELIRSLTNLASRERALHVEVLEYLNEVERRKLHVQLGYSSLFDYCTSRLQYSSSAAWRRIASARAMRRFPEIRGMLKSGDLNLVAVAMIAKVLTPANRDALLARVVGRSQDEVRGVVAEYRPEEVTRDRVRPVCVKETAPPAETIAPALVAAAAHTRQDDGPVAVAAITMQRGATPTATSGSGLQDIPAGTASEPPHTVVIRRHEIRFVAGQEFMKQLERMKILLATRYPSAKLEQVFAAAMEAFLDAKCPLRRAGRRDKRRVERRARRRAECGTRDAGDRGETSPPGVDRARKSPRAARPAPGRYIRAVVRDQVYQRDGGRCAWVGANGERCNATRWLELDHVTPFGRGGTSVASNLRLLCRAHNLLAAEQAYGKGVMARFTVRE